jgi:hypothetical protein
MDALGGPFRGHRSALDQGVWTLEIAAPAVDLALSPVLSNPEPIPNPSELFC